MVYVNVHLILSFTQTLIYTDPELLCPIFGNIQCVVLCLHNSYVHFCSLEFNDLTSNDVPVSFLRQFQNYFPANFNLNNATLFMLYFR